MSFAAITIGSETSPWLAPEQRLQRRTFKDYQPLFMLITGLDCVDDHLQREFACVQGPVWRRFNDATRQARQRRITVLFSSDENNLFEELLYVGCDYVRKRQHLVRSLWTHADWPLDEAMARHVCIGLAERSVLRASALTPPTTTSVTDRSAPPVGAHHPVQTQTQQGRFLNG